MARRMPAPMPAPVSPWVRTGVKFHDGTDFNADAVVYNFMRQKNAPKELRDSYNYYFGAVFNWAADSTGQIIAASTSTKIGNARRRERDTVVSSCERPPCSRGA